MSRFGSIRWVLGILLLVAASPLAHAGTCSNAQINQAYAAVHMSPNGTGTSGDCNPNNYGAGSWTSINDLETRIQHAHDCSDPWLGQIYINLYSRKPTSAECNISNYGGGHWSSYMDLTSKVQAYHNAPAASSASSSPYHFDSSLNIVDNSNRVIARAGTYNVISNDGGSMTPQQAAQVISSDSAGLTAGRSALGVGSKPVFVVTKR